MNQLNCQLFHKFASLCLVTTLLLVHAGCSDPASDNALESSANHSIDQNPESDSQEVAAGQANEDEANETPKRTFEFSYQFTINELPQQANVKIWFPVAESSQNQTVQLQQSVVPTRLQLNRDATYENQIGFCELEPAVGESIAELREPVQIALKYDVTRQEATVDSSAAELSDGERELYLKANALVPTSGKPQELLAGKVVPEDLLAAGRSLYEIVEGHMTYDKSKPGYGNGDAVWACDSKTGNCTDFHSLFISLARGKSIPARFEIGFPLPTEKGAGAIGGYHCWAWFHAANHGWVPVDISEADKHPELKGYYFGKLTADRITFSRGRDIELVPASETEPLNYFVYPHVEVDGRVWPKEKIKLEFGFQDKE